MKKKVFMFSGQGSHYYEMGKKLFDHNHVFRNCMLRTDDIVKDATGQSIVDMLYDGKKKMADSFENAVYSSPAIVMVEYALSRVLLDSGIKPDCVLGSSFGELTAAAVAEMVSIEDLLYFIVRFIKELDESAVKGRMIGILHNVSLYENTPTLKGNSEIAAINFDSHFVVSCRLERAGDIENFLRSKQISYQVLPVNQAFHSSLMDPVASVCKSLLKEIPLSSPKIPFISSTYSKAIYSLQKDYIWNVLRKPIQFQKTVMNLEQAGSYYYIDLGPSGTLSTFVKYILNQNSESMYFSTLTPFGHDLENLETVKRLIPKPSKLLKENRQASKVSGQKERKKMLAYVFPGQGAQKKGMGKSLFDDFGDLTVKADGILGYSIKDLCLKDANNQLGQTKYTQPAIYLVSALAYLKKIEETNHTPDFVAGHSLGEYAALFAAGVFDFETGLKLVKKRGELMGKFSGGGMAAVIGMSADQIHEVIKKNALSALTVANYNTLSQIVISGPKQDIDRAKRAFENYNGTLYIPLNVSGAFHSPFMTPAQQPFADYLREFDFKEPQIPVVSNVTARLFRHDNVKENLVHQLTNPIQWTDSIRYLMGKGEMHFEEIGPGNVLTGMVKKIQEEAEPIIVNECNQNDHAPSSPAVTLEIPLAKPSEPAGKETAPTIHPAEIPVSVRSTTDMDGEKKGGRKITADSLGSTAFKKAYNLKYPYVTGGMYHGIASKKLVAKIGKAGMLGFFGTGALSLDEIGAAIQYLKEKLNKGQAFGMNLLNGSQEGPMVDLFLKYRVNIVEAAAYMQMTPDLVRYRLKGLSTNGNGSVLPFNKLFAKVSRPEIATFFLSPAPEAIVAKLKADHLITPEEAKLSQRIPMADELIVEADSGGHTDQGIAYTLMPAMIRLRDEMMKTYRYSEKIRIGAAGGIGTPEAAAAAFILGADFLLTGSINQCTVEAGTSDLVKDLLQEINVQDTAYAPSGDMFELGAKIQVLRKGVFFPARANKLFELYKRHGSLEDIDEATKDQLQKKYFQKSFEEIFDECKAFYPHHVIEKAHANPKHKMSLIFRWYFGMTTQLALSGDVKRKVDCQIHTGPALGAFNQWVKGTELENWRARHVDQIAEKLMHETAEVLNDRLQRLSC